MNQSIKILTEIRSIILFSQDIPQRMASSVLESLLLNYQLQRNRVGPTEIIYQGKKKFRTQYEDLCKYDMADGKIHLMYLIVNQSKTDGKMLLRKAGYTGGVYREQYEEQMSGVFPVIELVLYWGRAICGS